MSWDRFDICEAWWLYMADWHEGQGSSTYALSGTFARFGFRPPMLLRSRDDLTENGQAIYDRLVSGEARIRDRR